MKVSVAARPGCRRDPALCRAAGWASRKVWAAARRGGAAGKLAAGFVPEKAASAPTVRQEGLSRGRCQAQVLRRAGSCRPVLQRVAGVTLPRREGWGWGLGRLFRGRKGNSRKSLITPAPSGGGVDRCGSALPPSCWLRLSAGRSSFLSPTADNTSFCVQVSCSIKGPSR